MSENGWQPSWVDQDALQWVTIPGTTVNLQLLKGIPATIMRAYAADYNAYVEPLRDADSAGYTPTNSVSTSNHLNGTAMDLNWNGHPFRVADAGYSPQMIATMREILDFYEDTMFWANNWDSPKDAMHHQMGYGTFEDRARCQDFIARKIRGDGFSTFRRVPGQSPTPQAAQVLAAATGLGMTRVSEILPTLQQGLALAQCNTPRRIAMFIAQTRHESDNYNTTVEYANGDTSQDRWKYKGRTWIQITWQSNYQKFGQWAANLRLINDPNQFVNNPESLADLEWAGIGAAWFWITPHQGHNPINDDTDRGDVDAVTYTINGGYTGLDQRTAFWNQALAQGDALLALTTTGDDMAQVPQDEWAEALDLLRQAAKYRRPSLSAFRHVGEGDVNTCAGFAWSADGSTHIQLVERLAVEYGDPTSVALLMEVAGADTAKYPDRVWDAKLAARVLTKVSDAAKAEANAQIKAWLDAEAVK